MEEEAGAARGAPLAVALPAGWLKLVVKAPGARVRTGPFDVMMTEGALVAHAKPGSAEVFVEAGSAQFVEHLLNIQSQELGIVTQIAACLHG